MHDLEECVFQNIEAALWLEDDLEPTEDAVRDTRKVPVNGGKRYDLVCGWDSPLVYLDLQDRRRIGALFCKTAGDPDLRGDSSALVVLRPGYSLPGMIVVMPGGGGIPRRHPV
ncbi:hypothetical protein [Methanoculleus sp.]|uniref:hypothetical protein n=1 Tax=Methanoculleus sp. TaxID=90427 RepID=UPI0032110E05